jgi:phospholipase/lecithinase/hemolysin
MQMLIVFTGKTFGLQIVELAKPFVIRKFKICLDLCKFQGAVKSVMTAPVKMVQGMVHVVADTLHPGEQEEECASAYVLARVRHPFLKCTCVAAHVMHLFRVLTCGLACDTHCASSAVSASTPLSRKQCRLSVSRIYRIGR